MHGFTPTTIPFPRPTIKLWGAWLCFEPILDLSKCYPRLKSSWLDNLMHHHLICISARFLFQKQPNLTIIGQKTTTIIGQMDSVSAEEQKFPEKVLGHFATKIGFDFFLSSLSFVWRETRSERLNTVNEVQGTPAPLTIGQQIQWGEVKFKTLDISLQSRYLDILEQDAVNNVHWTYHSRTFQCVWICFNNNNNMSFQNFSKVIVWVIGRS